MEYASIYCCRLSHAVLACVSLQVLSCMAAVLFANALDEVAFMFFLVFFKLLSAASASLAHRSRESFFMLYAVIALVAQIAWLVCFEGWRIYASARRDYFDYVHLSFAPVSAIFSLIIALIYTKAYRELRDAEESPFMPSDNESYHDDNIV